MFDTFTASILSWAPPVFTSVSMREATAVQATEAPSATHVEPAADEAPSATRCCEVAAADEAAADKDKAYYRAQAAAKVAAPASASEREQPSLWDRMKNTASDVAIGCLKGIIQAVLVVGTIVVCTVILVVAFAVGFVGGTMRLLVWILHGDPTVIIVDKEGNVRAAKANDA